MRLKIYQLHLAKIIPASESVWILALKETVVKLEVLTEIDMLLMVEQGIRQGVCNKIHQYPKANNKRL